MSDWNQRENGPGGGIGDFLRAVLDWKVLVLSGDLPRKTVPVFRFWVVILSGLGANPVGRLNLLLRSSKTFPSYDS